MNNTALTQNDLLPSASILISGLHLSLYLGWPAEERHHQQTIILDIAIDFPSIPHACKSDNLEDTICYSTLSHHILEKFTHQSFQLIEHLSKHIYDFIAKDMPTGTKITLDIIKHPAIPGLHGFIRFRYTGITA